MASESTTALSAVIVSGVVGILGVGGGLAASLIVSHRAHQDQVLQAREKLRRTDRDELRRVLDRAALGLSRALTLADEGRVDVLHLDPAHRRDRQAFLGDRRSFDARLAELPASEASLSIRLGAASRARDTYRRAIGALGNVSEIFRAVRDVFIENPQARHTTNEEIEVVGQIAKESRSAALAQTRFLREAHAIGRSMVDLSGNGSP